MRVLTSTIFGMVLLLLVTAGDAVSAQSRLEAETKSEGTASAGVAPGAATASDTITGISTASAGRILSYRERHDFGEIQSDRLTVRDLLAYLFRSVGAVLPDNNLLRYLMYLVAAGAVLYLITWLAYRSLNTAYFRKNAIPQPGNAGGLFTADPRLESPEEVLQSGDFRNAIRLMLLDSLLRLSADKKITLHKDKTNSDYLYELPEGAMREHFRTLSRIYNYVWYGEFEPAPAQVRAAQNAWNHLVKPRKKESA